MAFAIFDGHNDLLTHLWRQDDLAPEAVFGEGREAGHLDAPRMARGGMAGGFFAIWVPTPMDLGGIVEKMQNPPYDLPIPPEIPQDDGLAVVMAQAAILMRLERAGHLAICTTVPQIRAARDMGVPAAILHIEGAEAIGPDLAELDVLWRAGLRSVGPVWSRPTRFCDGVPFRFPADPDTGGGLTEAGRALVARCTELGLVVDLSHMTERGFWDVAEMDGPLVATHSNAHAICPHSRNLTDPQLRAVAQSGGIVGLNFATAMLRPDGRMVPDTGLDVMLAHLDHMIAVMGEDHVALGSDFDGAIVPEAIGDASGLPALIDAMRAHGYGETRIEKIAFENWMSVLSRIWHGG
jgi:membrane dipeptidase